LACAAPRRFHRRDSLLALFWPDLDTSHARGALRRALYFLRSALGDAVLVGRGEEEIGVDEGLLWSDVRAFERALADGRREEALGLYHGDLLEGFFISSAPDFERWLDTERAALRTAAARAAWSIAEETEPTDPQKSMEWAKRAASLTPDEEGPLRRLMQVLERHGDRAAALSIFAAFERRLADEFELTPSDETVALAGRIRTEGAAPPVVPDASALGARPPDLVAVLPFSVAAPAKYAYLAEGMVDLLSTKLDGTRALRVLDPRALLGWLAQHGPPSDGVVGDAAARFDAAHVLTGSVVVGGERVQLTATLHDRRGMVELVAEAAGEAEDELFDLVDEIARQLLASRSIGPAGRVARLAAHTTRSLPALKHYLEGEHAFRAGEYFHAIAAYQQAAAADPDFALAHYRLAAALAACAMPEGARLAASQAQAHRSRLTPHDQLWLDAQLAWLEGRSTEAERLYSDIVAVYPDNVEAWYLLGDLLFHHNPYRGRSITEARVPLERAIALDPDHVSAMGHLARIAAIEGRSDDVAELVDRILATSPTGDQALPMRALKAFTLSNAKEESDVLDGLKNARALTIGITFSDVALYSGNLAGTDRFARQFLAVARSPELQALCHIIVAHMEAMRGRHAAAFEALDKAQELDRAWALEMRGLFAAWPFSFMESDQVMLIRDELDAWDAASTPSSPQLPLRVHNGLHPYLRLYLLGLLNARLGACDRAAQCATALESVAQDGAVGEFPASLAAGLRARIAWEEGDHASALQALEADRPELWFQQAVSSPFFGRVLERFMRAELLWSLGRRVAAAAWYRSLVQRSPFELPFSPVVEARLHALALEDGDAAAARIHEARVRAMLADADARVLDTMARYAPTLFAAGK
jgi:serine/threonine-protein kinase